MLLIAMAPPMPFAGKLFTALLMLTLVGVLMRLVRGGTTNGRSIVLAATTSVVLLAALEAVLPRSYFSSFHDRGILAGIVGALSAIFFLQFGGRQEGNRRMICIPFVALAAGLLVGLLLDSSAGILASIVTALSAAYVLQLNHRQAGDRRLICLSVIALGAGPLMGLFLGLLGALCAHPMDRGYAVAIGTILGSIAGLIVAGILAAAALLSPEMQPCSQSKPDAAVELGQEPSSQPEQPQRPAGSEPDSTSG